MLLLLLSDKDWQLLYSTVFDISIWWLKVKSKMFLFVLVNYSQSKVVGWI